MKEICNLTINTELSHYNFKLRLPHSLPSYLGSQCKVMPSPFDWSKHEEDEPPEFLINKTVMLLMTRINAGLFHSWTISPVYFYLDAIKDFKTDFIRNSCTF